MVIERLYDLHCKINAYLEDDEKNNEEKLFAKELIIALDTRFPNMGTNIIENCIANYLDPRFRGVHLIELDKFEETKCNLQK